MKFLKKQSEVEKGSTLIGVIAIIIVAILLGGGFLGWRYYSEKEQESIEQSEIPVPEKQTETETETPKDETANWKTYRNKEYGFEIRYPNDAQIKKVDESISFIFSDNQRQLNVEVITGAEFNECYKTAWAADVPSISLSGVTFKGIGCGLKCEPYDKIQYCAIHNGIAYKLFPQIVYISEKHNFVEKDNILNQMLSTFKFID